jgi:hypothetical protein
VFVQTVQPPRDDAVNRHWDPAVVGHAANRYEPLVVDDDDGSGLVQVMRKLLHEERIAARACGHDVGKGVRRCPVEHVPQHGAHLVVGEITDDHPLLAGAEQDSRAIVHDDEHGR